MFHTMQGNGLIVTINFPSHFPIKSFDHNLRNVKANTLLFLNGIVTTKIQVQGFAGC